MTSEALEYGIVQAVSEETAGDELLADVAAGALSLPLGDAVDFDEDGGQLLVDGVELGSYSSADLDADTLQLSGGLASAYLEGTSVQVYPPVVERRALVQLDLDGEAIDARVPHALFDRLPLGTRENGERVSLFLDGQEWVLADVLGKEPTVDGSFVDPATLPDVSAPTEPPPSSPAVTVHGTVDALVVTTEPIDATTVLTYQFSADYDDETGIGTWTDLPEMPTRSTVLTIARLPSGEALEKDANYAVRVIASNVVDSAAPGPATTAQLDETVASSQVMASVTAGFALVGSLDVGGAITLSPDEGLVIEHANGLVSRLSEGASEIAAYLTALGLTVKGSADFYQQVQLFQRTVLANGITDPKVLPTMARSWASVDAVAGIGAEWTHLLRGLCQRIDGVPGDWVTLITVPWVGTAWRSINKTTGEVWPYYDVSAWGDGFLPDGIASTSAHYYVVGYDTARDNRVFVYKINPDLTKAAEWEVLGSGSGNDRRRTIGINGLGQVIVAWGRTTGDEFRVRTYSTSGVVAITRDYGHSLGSAAMELGGVAEGTFDFGSGNNTILIAPSTGGKVYAYVTDIGGPITSRDFGTANASQLLGLVWDGTRFHSLGSSAVVWSYGAGNPATQTFHARYTWDDTDPLGVSPGTHRTAASPSASYSLPARAMLVVEGKVAPHVDVDDPSQHDLAKNVGIWAGTSSAATYLQTVLAPGEVQAVLPGPLSTATGPAPTITNFVGTSVSPGTLESEVKRLDGKPKTSLSGGGAGNVDGLLPPGSITMFGGPTIPTGWLLCDGASLSTALYPDLYAAIGYSHGGSGSSFLLPDLRGRFPHGVNPGNRELGYTETGAPPSSNTLADRHDRMDHRHTHSISGATGTVISAATGTGQGNLTRFSNFDTHAHGGETGSKGTAGGNVAYHPQLALNFIIKT